MCQMSAVIHNANEAVVEPDAALNSATVCNEALIIQIIIKL